MGGSISQQEQLMIYDFEADENYKMYEVPSLKPIWNQDGEWIASYRLIKDKIEPTWSSVGNYLIYGSIQMFPQRSQRVLFPLPTQECG